MEWKQWVQAVKRAGAVGLLMASLGSAQAQESKPVYPMEPLWIRWGNGLRTEYLVFNAMLTNKDAVSQLINNPLNDDTFQNVPELNEALHDPAARQFMKYLVSCALENGEEVSWSPVYTPGTQQTWKGGGGICNDWGKEAPTQECLEQVSACILARNNPMALRVRVALRCTVEGCADSLRPMETVVPDNSIPSQVINAVPLPAQLIPSFLPCPENSSGECGWSPLVVGTCEPQQEVDFFAMTSQELKGSLRVCEGLHGCAKGDKALIVESPVDTSDKAEVAFDCPDGGSFSVMSRLPPEEQPKQVTGTWESVHTEGASSALPGEAETFPAREGAFYGNLFDPEAIRPGVSVWFDTGSLETRLRLSREGPVYVRQDEGWCQKAGATCLPAMPVVGGGQPIYLRAYVCAAPGWSGDGENLPGRVCALPQGKGNCAAHLEGSCRKVCKENDDGSYAPCESGNPSKTWDYPITTFMPSPP
ncbi:hypothetical protein [Hyalangium minutum]|uniref:Putative lipoprotein n=1 Tax=Hyalangium minutum TaxID=394096 RepID=A0A085W3V5_9BACT|nr:hypothetical protein [Hyalangium minutum]KFE62368.1 putative lipoprotein [Hyalangium minutum]